MTMGDPEWDIEEKDAQEDDGIPTFEQFIDRLQARSVNVLVRCLDRVETMLDEAEEMDDLAESLKIVNRATSVAKSLITTLRSLKKREHDSGSGPDDPTDDGLDPELLSDARRRVSGVNPGSYVGEAGHGPEDAQ
jgi:hypothetical protein